MELEDWGALYKELAVKLTDLDGINWLDLWHNQVGFLVEEHPFPTPAAFLSFRILNPENLGAKTQRVNVQIDIYYFYETFLDTNMGAYNQTDALAYLKTNNDIHRVLHGSSGENYSEMTRIGFHSVDTGSSGNLYKQSFVCSVIDASASPKYNEASPGELAFGKGTKPEEDNEAPYIIPH